MLTLVAVLLEAVTRLTALVHVRGAVIHGENSSYAGAPRQTVAEWTVYNNRVSKFNDVINSTSYFVG